MIRLKTKYENPHPTTLLAKSYHLHHHQYPANPTATLLIPNQPYETGATAHLSLQMHKTGAHKESVNASHTTRKTRTRQPGSMAKPLDHSAKFLTDREYLLLGTGCGTQKALCSPYGTTEGSRVENHEAVLLRRCVMGSDRLTTGLPFNKNLRELASAVSALGEFMWRTFIHSFKHSLSTCLNQALGTVPGNRNIHSGE